MKTSEGEMVTIAQAARETGIPVRTLRWYAQTKKIWAERRTTDLGVPYWITTRQEIERVKRMYKPHVVKIP